MLDPLSKIAVIHGLRHALSTRTARRTRSTPPLNGYDYPGRFSGLLHARGWLAGFFGWANDEHHHSGLALFTPADVFYDRVEVVRAVRQLALDAAYRLHPERFSHGAPRVTLPPSEVFINPITSDAISVVASAAADAPPSTVDDGVTRNATGLPSAARATRTGCENSALAT